MRESELSWESDLLWGDRQRGRVICNRRVTKRMVMFEGE